MKFLCVSTLGLFVLGLTGCDPGTYTGGGWTDSPADPDAKATFGGNFQAIDENSDGQVFDPFSGTFDPEDTFKGQFQYNDQGADVAFHGTVDGAYICPNDGEIVAGSGTLPEDWGIPGAGYLEGTYQPIPKTLGKGGRFEVFWIDNGEPGASAGDQIWVVCIGGALDGYSNDDTPLSPDADGILGQLLQGGNLDFHPPEDD